MKHEHQVLYFFWMIVYQHYMPRARYELQPESLQFTIDALLALAED